MWAIKAHGVVDVSETLIGQREISPTQQSTKDEQTGKQAGGKGEEIRRRNRRNQKTQCPDAATPKPAQNQEPEQEPEDNARTQIPVLVTWHHSACAFKLHSKHSYVPSPWRFPCRWAAAGEQTTSPKLMRVTSPQVWSNSARAKLYLEIQMLSIRGFK